MLIGLRPGDDAYDDNTGMVYHPQDESGGGNVAFYEIQDPTDELLFDIRDFISGFDSPVLVMNTIFGATDFALRDRNGDSVVVEEQSGFDSDVWVFDIGDASGRFRLTDFDTGNGVDGTQAGWYAYCRVLPAQ